MLSAANLQETFMVAPSTHRTFQFCLKAPSNLFQRSLSQTKNIETIIHRIEKSIQDHNQHSFIENVLSN